MKPHLGNISHFKNRLS